MTGIAPGLQKPQPAFTLAELLIALAILGVIATFTIPKVLQTQQDRKYNAMAKEAAGYVSDAYRILASTGSVNANTKTADLTPYLNYVSVKTAGLVDSAYTYGTRDCASLKCLNLHNGAVIYYYATTRFCGTTDLHAIWFGIDPDGKVTDGTTNGPGKSVEIDIYYNGKLRTFGTLEDNTTSSCSTYGANPNADPPWFSWN